MRQISFGVNKEDFSGLTIFSRHTALVMGTDPFFSGLGQASFCGSNRSRQRVRSESVLCKMGFLATAGICFVCVLFCRLFRAPCSTGVSVRETMLFFSFWKPTRIQRNRAVRECGPAMLDDQVRFYVRHDNEGGPAGVGSLRSGLGDDAGRGLKEEGRSR